MASATPELSIGLPVYNGEQYLRQAIDSILGQTYTCFELIISDNASTDGTQAICQEFARRDKRVRYTKHDANRGSAENFNFTFHTARGKYFKWAAHDDILAPTFLERCIDVLDRDPAVVLSYTRANRINAFGEIDGTYDYAMRVDDNSPAVRFHDLIYTNHFCVAIFGVMRHEMLAQTPLIGKYVGSDRTLLAEISLMGKLYEVPDYLFNRRDHPHTSTRMYSHRSRLAWFDPRQKGHITLPYWRSGLEHFRSIRRHPLPGKTKRALYGASARWFWFRRRVLIEDIKGVIVQVFPFVRTLSSETKTLLKKQS